ncbi:hypothetical protein EIN_060660 [Entamoeba invadens IP1]|uniref:SWIRM domain-containing protein n=1 Tax=Entamoeba invadens TaxID=33085 RepID=S0B084_ENTIV|nr:hypothetical protein EIN_060660 [Entamoeba invadens IP1]ELP93521.1 hypothetical protein EIN_060660 [Entamoeba invadens IP1]BAN40579.1 hypothetical protein [Entamoeba invadens]|eukprot:XP_004260292.1 hypothetical protein EIN_060660 [Entamoeba invadens IP1]
MDRPPQQDQRYPHDYSRETAAEKRKRVFETMITGFREINVARKDKKRHLPQVNLSQMTKIPPNPFDINFESELPSPSCFVPSTETSTEHSGSTGRTYVTTSSYKSEFDRSRIQQVEIDQNQEFFVGRAAKTPERYVYIRNAIVDLWEKMKPKYISKTLARQQIKDCGDVNCVGRVHSFLERMQWINNGKVVGKYIRTQHKSKMNDAVMVKDNTHVILCASALLVLDMHCRLIENPVGLIVGKQVTPLLFVIEDVVPIGVGKCDLPEDTRVVGVYYDETNHFPYYLEASYPYWILRLVWKRKDHTFTVIRKDKQVEVGIVEVVKREDIKRSYQSSSVFTSLLNAYLTRNYITSVFM